MNVRVMAPEERPFIASSWVRSYEDSRWAEHVTPRAVWAEQHRGGAEYRAGQNRLVDRLLERATVRVIEDDVGLVAGWLCFEPSDLAPVVHYIYTRERERRKGVARALMADLREQPCVFTHWSRHVVVKRIPAGWRYDKYQAFRWGL